MYDHLLKPQTSIDSPQELLSKAVEYFQWCEETPLLEEQLFHYQGRVVRAELAKMRPFTKRGLAIFLNIPEGRLAGYKARDGEWREAVERIEQVIYTQKFEGAVAGLMNASIISRDLGLAERSELSGPNGGPIQTQDVTDEEALKDEARRLGIPLDAFGLGGEEEEGA